MTRVTTRVMTTVLLLAPGATGPKAQEPVRIPASPTFAFAPASLRVRVRGEPNAANRTLTIFIAPTDAVLAIGTDQSRCRARQVFAVGSL